MKSWFFFAIFCMNSLAFASSRPTIYFALGKLTGPQKSILDRVFFSEVEKLKKQWPSVDFKRLDSPETDELISVLSSPSTLGLAILGHPAVSIRGEGTERHIMHGYLQTASSRYLPKTLLSAAHSSLGFISIITCHDSAISPLYLKALPQNFSGAIFRSPTHNLDALANPLLEFTSFYSTPEFLKEMNGSLPELLKEFNNFGGAINGDQLKISWRDQLSNHFSYEIIVNGKLAGVLESEYSTRGRGMNLREKLVQLSIVLAPGDQITIRPDDAFRPRINTEQKVVDDILLDRVSIIRGEEEKSLLAESVHIGDEENSPDQNAPLGFLRNGEDYSRAPFVVEWKGVVR
jgi:hypothetical protein